MLVLKNYFEKGGNFEAFKLYGTTKLCVAMSFFDVRTSVSGIYELINLAEMEHGGGELIIVHSR